MVANGRGDKKASVEPESEADEEDVPLAIKAGGGAAIAGAKKARPTVAADRIRIKATPEKATSRLKENGQSGGSYLAGGHQAIPSSDILLSNVKPGRLRGRPSRCPPVGDQGQTSSSSNAGDDDEDWVLKSSSDGRAPFFFLYWHQIFRP